MTKGLDIMKVVTKSVIIENEEFILIRDKHEDREYLGTIPYTELTEDGRMKRALNGFQICIEFLEDYKDLGACINGALNNRRRRILTERFLESHPEIDVPAGKGVEEFFKFINNLK